MSKFSKQRNSSAPEVSSARSRLDGLLQGLIEKQEESPHTEEDSPTHDVEEHSRDAMGCTTPKKQMGRHIRKRRKGKEEAAAPEMSHYHHTYVMKLFDRSVDLAQFDEDSPLYPICRAWIRNQPQNRNMAPRDRSPSDTEVSMEEDESNDEHVYRLPPPECVMKTEPGQATSDLRIPANAAKPLTLNINYDPAKAPSMEQLRQNHLTEWKTIRQRWKNAAHLNETRFARSTKILHDMYEAQCKLEQ